MKKLMLLGGSRYILPVIETAHKLGIYVITCDYLPDNVAHKYSDEYKNISIIDKEAVLKFAQEKRIDGIMSFACDPGVTVAAYVAEEMHLPFQGSYHSVCILQDKGLFREFLYQHGFHVPRAKVYSNIKEAVDDIDFFKWPVIVKPVDSSGSKGVSKCDRIKELERAAEEALAFSLKKKFIIEEFLTFKGYHSSTDIFAVDGELKFVTYSDHLFDSEADNPHTPTTIIWPTTMKKESQDYLTKELQRLMRLLGLKSGIYNVETCVDIDNKPYIMEVSPRGGGGKIAEIQEMAYGIKLIENEIRQAVGFPVKSIVQSQCNGYWCKMVIHEEYGKSGILDHIAFKPEIENKYIKSIELAVKQGDYIKPFTGANMSLGDIFLKFSSREELDRVVNNSKEWLRIQLK